MKCLAIGMNPNYVLSEEERKKRFKKKNNSGEFQAEIESQPGRQLLSKWPQLTTQLVNIWVWNLTRGVMELHKIKSDYNLLNIYLIYSNMNGRLLIIISQKYKGITCSINVTSNCGFVLHQSDLVMLAEQ